MGTVGIYILQHILNSRVLIFDPNGGGGVGEGGGGGNTNFVVLASELVGGRSDWVALFQLILGNMYSSYHGQSFI